MKHKGKIRRILALCLVASLVLFSQGLIVVAEEPENSTALTEEGNVPMQEPQEPQPEDTDSESSDQQEIEQPIQPEEEPAGEESQESTEEVQKDETVTSMDVEGNITEVADENGMVEHSFVISRSAALSGSSTAIVNFNTKGNAVTNYTEYGTGAAGYTNGLYGADGLYLGTENGKVKFMLSGVIGLVNAGEVQILNMSNAASLSHYVVSGGRLLHYISTNVNSGGYATSLDNGPAPGYLREGVQYYSYDGHYFYTRDQFGEMARDCNAGNRSHAVNSAEPYYNYFQYLPLRSQTQYSVDQLNSVIHERAVNSSSKMWNSAGIFVNYQNTYGVNALLAIGVGANESAWGRSSIAQSKNNLFGLNAVDASPGISADSYTSVDHCIKTFTETYMSKRYLNPNNGVYCGGYLGNKASGMNVKYASDPYWGEKNANIAWLIDKRFQNAEVYKYSIGVKDVMGTGHTNLNVRAEASTSARVMYQTKAFSPQAFILLDQGAGGFYKIQSDGVLDAGRTGISASGNYNFGSMYGYVSSNYVTLLSKGSGAPDTPPTAVKGIKYRAHVQDIGWQDYVTDGRQAGTTGRNLPMEALEVSVQDIADLGIEYRAHVQDLGWLDMVSDGATAGTVGKVKKMEAVQMKLTGKAAGNYDLYYRTHVSEFGWLDWAKNGELAGTQGDNYSLQAVQILLQPKGAAAPGNTLITYKINTVKLEYKGHVQDIGWMDPVSNGQVAGTTGKNKKIESLTVSVKSNTKLGIKYRVHAADIGWMDYVTDGKIAGTVGQNRRLEALQMELTGTEKEKYDLYYRMHVQDIGWMGWAKNGEKAGTENFALKVEALQIVIIPKGNPALENGDEAFRRKPTTVTYSAHVQDIGWMDFVKDGSTAGTTGRNKHLEALKISLERPEYTGSIRYRAHVQDIGWMNPVSNGAVAGTVGRNKPTEAVCIELTGKLAEEFDIYYRVHASEFGWLGWAKNGEKAGSEGYARHMEAVEIKLVKKGEKGPQSGTTPCFYSK